MAKTMRIQVKPGLRIPHPENSYRYIEGPDPVDVDVSRYELLEYWTRRVDHGEADLVQASALANKE